MMSWNVSRARLQRAMADLPGRPMLIMLQEVHCPAASGISTSHGYMIFYAYEEEKIARVAVAVRADARVKVLEVEARRLAIVVVLTVAGRRLQVASPYILHETSLVN